MENYTKRKEMINTPRRPGGPETIASELGESYQYVRSILENRVALAKIEGAEAVSILAGGALLVLLVTLFTFFVSIGLTVLLCIYLAAVLQSVYVATALVLLVYTGVGFGVWFFRDAVVYRPIRLMVFHSLKFK